MKTISTLFMRALPSLRDAAAAFLQLLRAMLYIIAVCFADDEDSAEFVTFFSHR